jgi:tetratricopeptide (TPR) repeat protein
LLESLKVETAFITIPGHVLIAFALASNQDAARKTFRHTEELIFLDGKVWVPLEVAECKNSFLDAWLAGARQWRTARKAHLCAVSTFESSRKAVSSAESGSALSLPDERQVVDNFQREVARVVDWEIEDQRAPLMAAMNQSDDSPKALNALGLLYVRYDLRAKAEALFQEAVKGSEYVPALVNLGNLRLLAKQPMVALGFYKRAAAAAPNEPAVLLGLARSHHWLQAYHLARLGHEELQRCSPEIAAQFSYLSVSGEDAERAAEANGVKEIMVWGEEK